MSQRDRLAPGAVSEPATPAVETLPRPRPAEPHASSRRDWEETFAGLLPTLQGDLAHCDQRDHSPSANGAGEGTRKVISHILNDALLQLEPAQCPAISFADCELGEPQREAVRRALGTPDLCLVQGLPGTGKARVTAEIVIQTALRGGRVLLVASHAAAIDQVLEQVGKHAAMNPIRCLGKGERAEQLPAAVRSFTFADRERHWANQAVKGAAASVEQAEARCRRLRQHAETLGRLAELAEQSANLDEELGKLNEDQAQTAVEVERLAAAFEAGKRAGSGNGFPESLAEAWTARQQVARRLQETRSELQRGSDGCRHRLGELAPAIAKLTPLIEAKRHGRWWTPQWWRATFRGQQISMTLGSLEDEQKKIETELARLEDEERRLASEDAVAEQAYRRERDRLCRAETARRREQSPGRAADLQRQRRVLEESAAALARELDSSAPQLSAGTPAAIQAALTAVRQQLAGHEQQVTLAREQSAAVAQHIGRLPAWLAAHANLVAAPLAALPTDRHFGDAAGITFDLLVVEEAHLAAEPDLLRLLTRARRWILVGQPEAKLPFAKSGGSSPTPRALFQRLWERLHCDPRRLPYSWLHENGHWCCRLRALTGEQRRQLECERVADCPDIELRILAQPRTAPALAEVAFPQTMSLAQAKEYIYRELQELAVQSAGHTVAWAEDADRVVLRLADARVPEEAPVSLENGVRELVSTTQPSANGSTSRLAGHTCGLEFERSAGWDRARAEQWLQRHLGLKDWGRTIRLHLPRRTEQPAPRSRETQVR